MALRSIAVVSETWRSGPVPGGAKPDADHNSPVRGAALGRNGGGLCCGAGLEDSALLGNIVSSITIQQIGTTGTATPQQVIRRYAEFLENKKIIT
jgi:hypothetical protein